MALAAVLALMTGSVLLAGPLDRKEIQTEKLGSGQGLIRKDLLRPPRVADVRPRRNIFVGGGATSVLPGPPSNFVQSQAETPSNESGAESVGPDIRYVGCVVTPRRTVAIILVDGQALAVAEGDQVAAIFTVQKISPQALDLADGDGQRRTISIEGEKQ
jgi:hypothetical protein